MTCSPNNFVGGRSAPRFWAYDHPKQETSAIAEKPTRRHVASHSMQCLRDICLQTVGWPSNWGLGSLKVNKFAII